ncbi:hypothetical protein L1887_39215 [Cichorium endivia]|nr:hypothetical protein L1887_39215 [Cichorium endivia]
MILRSSKAWKGQFTKNYGNNLTDDMSSKSQEAMGTQENTRKTTYTVQDDKGKNPRRDSVEENIKQTETEKDH